MMALLQQAASADNDEVAHRARMRVHMIQSDMMVKLDASSKLNTE